MALKLLKEVKLNGNAEIGGEPVVQMSSTVGSETIGGTGYSEYIVDNEKYLANLVEIRKDIKEFRDVVYKVEDEMLAESLKS